MRPASTTTAASPRARTSCANLRAPHRAGLRDGRAADPALSLQARRARRAGRSHHGCCVRAGPGAPEWRRALRWSSTGRAALLQRPRRLRRAGPGDGLLHRLRWARLPTRRGGQRGRGRDRAPRAAADRDRFALPQAQEGPGSRNQPLNVAVTATWLRDLRGDDPDVFGQALVDNFDLFVGARRAGADRPPGRAVRPPASGPVPGLRRYSAPGSAAFPSRRELMRSGTRGSGRHHG